MIDRQQIIDEARKWLGVRFRHQGRTVHGIDCAGLVAVVGNELGLIDFDYTTYKRQSLPHVFIDTFRGIMKEKSMMDRLPGDVLLTRSMDHTCHSVFFSEMPDGSESMIHAYAITRKVVEEPFDGDWLRLTSHCFAFHGLED